MRRKSKGCLVGAYLAGVAVFAVGTMICAIPGVSTLVAVGTLALGIPLLAIGSALLLLLMSAPMVVTLVWGKHRRWGVLASLLLLGSYLVGGNIVRAGAIERYEARVDAMNEPWVELDPYRSAHIGFPSYVRDSLYKVPILSHDELDWVRLQPSAKQWVRQDAKGVPLPNGEPFADLRIDFRVDHDHEWPEVEGFDAWFVRPNRHTVVTIQQGEREFQRHGVTATVALPLLIVGTFEIKQFSGPSHGGLMMLGMDRSFGSSGFEEVMERVGLTSTPSNGGWQPSTYKERVNAREIRTVLDASGDWTEAQTEVVHVWCRERDRARERAEVLPMLIRDARAHEVKWCPPIDDAGSSAVLTELLAWAEAHPPQEGGPLVNAWALPLHRALWLHVSREPAVLRSHQAAIEETARRTKTVAPPIP